MSTENTVHVNCKEKYVSEDVYMEYITMNMYMEYIYMEYIYLCIFAAAHVTLG